MNVFFYPLRVVYQDKLSLSLFEEDLMRLVSMSPFPCLLAISLLPPSPATVESFSNPLEATTPKSLSSAEAAESSTRIEVDPPPVFPAPFLRQLRQKT